MFRFRPKSIAPELVQIGDTIRVEYASNDGVTRFVEGIVAKRVDHGESRAMLTKEGGRLFTWGSRRDPRIHITLLNREISDTPMFGMDEIRERIK